MKDLSKTNVSIQSEQKEKQNIVAAEIKEQPEVKHDSTKSLKELKEMAIVLRQKLDALESEKNVMEVEYSQVRDKGTLFLC